MIEKTFQYHRPSPKGVEKIEQIREAFSVLLRTIHEISPANSRHKAECITHLETSAMFATKNIVFSDSESQVE